MNVKELQQWINAKIIKENLPLTLLKDDGVGGPLTRSTFIMLFVNKSKTSTQIFLGNWFKLFQYKR